MSDLDTSLIEHWKLDETSGVRAGSVSGLDLTDNNTVSTGDPKVGSASAHSAYFQAANLEYFSRATSSSLECGDIDFTWACWVYLTFNGQVGVNTVLYKEAQSGQRDYWLYVENATLVFAKENASGTFKAVSAGFKLPNFKWNFVVAWHDAAADTLNIQVNGGTPVSAAMAAAGQSVGAGVGSFLMGSSGAAGQYMDGVVDSVSFWKRTLTSNERAQIYNEGNGLDYPFSPTVLFGQVVPGYKTFNRRFLAPRIST